MILKSEEDISKLIREDKWMMDILKCTRKLSLPDWWICAGFVRSKVWDVLHNVKKRTEIPDIDVIYYNPANIEENEEKKLEKVLNSLYPAIPWSVKNQARMHIVNTVSPYSSSVDAISKFPETATALGVKLDREDNVVLVAPHGITDLVNLKVKPTPNFYFSKARMQIYETRVRRKNWKSIWKGIVVTDVGVNR
ncbi:nucleotidyltransferase family protein [Filibacter tadaridae]|uniref:Nucleotidyltransferase family protein n=1 Tax=Filibacter tadaridae TaxID=2483811 RepID=A0A3P5X9X8_9BACL|nr:nucleotidyltransferase family protein [Filibacter tadaridae]VDC28072.1 hypothetical protein FILTAD_01693 [Filibacter tadaridae]